MFCLGSTGFQLIARHSVSVDQDGFVSSEKLMTLKKRTLFTSAVQKDVFASRNFSLPYSIYTLGSYNISTPICLSSPMCFTLLVSN